MHAKYEEHDRKRLSTVDRSMQVYEKVPLAECHAPTGGAPIGVRWVDVQRRPGEFRSR